MPTIGHAPRSHGNDCRCIRSRIMALDRYDCARIPAQREPMGQAVGSAAVKQSPTGQRATPQEMARWLVEIGFKKWSTTGRPET